MKELMLFYYPECPYCQRAFRFMDELFAEHPEYRGVPLRLVDEHKEAALADSYDYWYVPTYYMGDEKLSEGVKEKRLIEEAFQKAYNS